jgi:drug/metabolite transporter (DMT)-like permease
MASTTTASLSSQARPLNGGATAVIVLLCLCWGLNQVAIKLTFPDLPPFTQAAIRTLGGLAVVYAWARFRGISLSVRDGTLIPGVVAGCLFGLEFILIFEGMLYTSASRASLFLYTAPFFVAVGARFLLPGERLGLTQWIGLALSFAGVVLAIGAPHSATDGATLLGDLMLLGGGAAWGITTLLVKATKLSDAPPEKTLIYQIFVGGLILAAAALISGEQVTGFPRAVAASWMVYQILVVGLTFTAWFTLVQRFSATRVSAFTFLTPLFGVVAGYLLLNETVTITFAVAVVFVVVGLVLVNRPR